MIANKEGEPVHCTVFVFHKCACTCQNKSQVFTFEIGSKLNTEYVFMCVVFTFVNVSLDTVRSLTIPASGGITAC